MSIARNHPIIADFKGSTGVNLILNRKNDNWAVVQKGIGRFNEMNNVRIVEVHIVSNSEIPFRIVWLVHIHATESKDVESGSDNFDVDFIIRSIDFHCLSVKYDRVTIC